MKENKIYGCIYKITNLVNNKVYIGQSTRVSRVIERKYKGSGKVIHLAIKKYGWENFKVEILEYAENQNELNDKEPAYIKHYNSLAPNGYNIKKGGAQGGPGNKFSEESRAKCRLNSATKGKPSWNKGKRMPDTMRKKMSDLTAGENNYFYGKRLIGSLNGMFGKTHSEEFKQRFSNQRKGSGNPAFGRKWANNGKENRFLRKDEPLPEGWRFGHIKILKN
jgi:group I intron endonuclease